VELDIAALDEANASLKRRGFKGRLIAHNGALYWRGTFTDASGVRKDRRIHLGIPAQKGMVLEAESRVVDLFAAIRRLGTLPDPLPWASDSRKSSASLSPKAMTVAEGVSLLEADFWKNRERTAAAERTWQRLNLELNRLPSQATLTVPLLQSVAESTKAGSRTRLEACKVLKRLGRLTRLEGIEVLDESRTSYSPQERRTPSDEELLELIRNLPPNHHWSWPTWALITYGCRPAEVFSLRPDTDGTAQVLTVKQKKMRPAERTALALPVGDSEPPEDNRCWRYSTATEYDSFEAKRHTGAWGKWLGARTGGLQLYALRHAWALRSIRRNINPSLAAETMGHSLEVHNNTYHRALSKRDVAAVAASLGNQW